MQFVDTLTFPCEVWRRCACAPRSAATMYHSMSELVTGTSILPCIALLEVLKTSELEQEVDAQKSKFGRPESYSRYSVAPTNDASPFHYAFPASTGVCPWTYVPQRNAAVCCALEPNNNRKEIRKESLRGGVQVQAASARSE